MKVPEQVARSLSKFPDFQDISLENQAAVDWLFAQYSPEISEYTFTNLFIWRLTRPIKLTLLDGYLCVLAQKNDGNMSFMPPVRDGDVCALTEALFSFMQDSGHKPQLVRVPEDMANRLKTSGFHIEPDEANSDYVYLVEDLANLAGRKFDGKRNRIKKCLRKYSPEYETMTTDIVDECLQLQEEWCNVRHCELDPGLESENIAIKELFSHIESLPVFGCAVVIRGRIEAFSIGEKLNEQTAVIHFEKANSAIDGIYQLVNQWFCQNALTDYIYVNREQDLGIPGLRKAKQSYHPHHMVNKYTITRKQ